MSAPTWNGLPLYGSDPEVIAELERAYAERAQNEKLVRERAAKEQEEWMARFRERAKK